MTVPLRPELYRRLVDCFGHVTIARAGEPIRARVVTNAQGRRELVVEDSGEYYAVNCPWCADTRQRLWINHRWGRYEPTLKSKNLFLAHCYNENCLSVPGRSQQLYSLVFSDFLHEAPDIVHPGRVNREGLIQAEWPGRMILVNELDRCHPARRYLEQERHYDANVLATVYDVRFCLEPEDKYRMAAQRFIIPITLNGILQGWQARFVGTPQSKMTPKYYSMPGMKRNQLLYNFDNARKHPFVVVMEGPTDAWSFGPEAVALFGKSASTTQLDLIARHWQKVYVCLDGDAVNDGQGIYDALGSKVKEKHLITLPPNLDPGDLPQAELRSRVLDGRVGSPRSLSRAE